MTTNIVKRHSMTGGELLPDSDALGDLWRVCQRVIGTGFLPDSIRSPEQAFAIALKGRELGIPPMMAFAGLYIIKGKVELTASMMSAMLRRGGVRIEEVQVDATMAHLRFDRDGEKAEVCFTMEDAKRANLVNQTWSKYPRQMLYARALSEGARRIGPDLVSGAYVSGEISAEVGGNGSGIKVEAEFIEEAPKAPESIEEAPEKVERFVLPPKEEASEEVPEPKAKAKRQPAKASEAQVKKLVVMCHKVNLTDDEVHAMLRGLYGDGVSSRKDLTKAQATALIDALTTLAEQGPESHRWDKINAAISKGQETNNGG
jgi:hypothetical protein